MSREAHMARMIYMNSQRSVGYDSDNIPDDSADGLDDRRQCRWIKCHLRWTIKVCLYRFTQIRPISEGNLEKEIDNTRWTGCLGGLKVPRFVSWFAERPNQRLGAIPTRALDLPICRRFQPDTLCAPTPSLLLYL